MKKTTMSDKLQKEAYKKKKQKESSPRRRKILKIVLFWIYYPAKWIYEYKNRAYRNLKFSEEKLKKLFDKYLPKIIADWQPQFDLMIFSNTDEYGIFNWQNRLENKYIVKSKKARDFFGKFRAETRIYLFEKYELEGYKRMYFDAQNIRMVFNHFAVKEGFPPCGVRGVVFYNPSRYLIPTNGKWHNGYEDDFWCSVCGNRVWEIEDKCSNCGAKMEECNV